PDEHPRGTQCGLSYALASASLPSSATHLRGCCLRDSDLETQLTFALKYLPSVLCTLGLSIILPYKLIETTFSKRANISHSEYVYQYEYVAGADQSKAAQILLCFIVAMTLTMLLHAINILLMVINYRHVYFKLGLDFMTFYASTYSGVYRVSRQPFLPTRCCLQCLAPCASSAVWTWCFFPKRFEFSWIEGHFAYVRPVVHRENAHTNPVICAVSGTACWTALRNVARGRCHSRLVGVFALKPSKQTEFHKEWLRDPIKFEVSRRPSTPRSAAAGTLVLGPHAGQKPRHCSRNRVRHYMKRFNDLLIERRRSRVPGQKFGDGQRGSRDLGVGRAR
uniref:G_PROTEIN_RECEP_F1_2 domain-containing protein n=1 Tax=Macrostomum lignano TaxID=282301 RepID=A0A1I8FBK5_9PLAT